MSHLWTKIWYLISLVNTFNRRKKVNNHLFCHTILQSQHGVLYVALGLPVCQMWMIVCWESKVTKKIGASESEEASFYGWQRRVSQVIFKAWKSLHSESSSPFAQFFLIAQSVLLLLNIFLGRLRIFILTRYLWNICEALQRNESKFILISLSVQTKSFR